MDPRIRFGIPLVALGLIITRAFVPDFLAAKAFWVISWFAIVIFPLLYLSAWLLTPPLVQGLVRWGRGRLFLPAFFLALFVGALWMWDQVIWAFFQHFAPSLPDSRALEFFTLGLLGRGGAEM